MEKLTDAIGIVLFESEKFGGEKVLRGGICPTLRANKTSSGVIEVMADVKIIGQMDNTIDHTFESANRVYDVEGVAPTMNTCGGGGLQPKILEEQIPCKLNKMPEGHLDSLDNAKICDVDTPTASTITSRYYKGIGAHKDNMCIVAMRGRNPDNPSDRTTGSPTEQRLEVNMQGTSNCLTSVQKDNLVMESQVLTPKRTEYGKQIRKAYESGQIQESRHNMTELEPRKDGVSNTLTTVQKDNLLLEKPQYRIRKLTPRECGRLMGVSDEDIDKMAAVNSNTQLYKQFGNSIVVDVMCAMFKNLNINQ